MRAKYVNPFTDFGFKKLFGEEASKPALIDFLNALLSHLEHVQVDDLFFRNTEQLGYNSYDRKAIYDIYCENHDGEKFVVELQKARQDFFKERTVFYSTFPIRDQAEQGGWNFDLKAVYCIGILDFVFRDYEKKDEARKVIHHVKLKDQHCNVFYDKLCYIYIEMPNFVKTEAELETRLDKWLYFIKHLEDFQQIPGIFQKEVVFVNALEKANIDNFTREQMEAYEGSLKVFRDAKNIVDSAYGEGVRVGKEEGIAEGITAGKMEMARALKRQGIAVEVIMQASGLERAVVDHL